MIGIAGTEEKCRYVEKLGATVCLNYRSPSFEQDLFQETEGFVDVYFGQSYYWDPRQGIHISHRR